MKLVSMWKTGCRILRKIVEKEIKKGYDKYLAALRVVG